MVKIHDLRLCATLVLAFGLGACSLADEGLWPTLTGEDPVAPGTRDTVQIAPSPAESYNSPLLEPGAAAPPVQNYAGAPQVVPLGPSAPPPRVTGTFVGQKVASLSGEVNTLRQIITQQNNEYQQILNNTAQNSQRYHAVVGAISARLQVGTTPGNPVLVSQWQSAQGELDRVVADASQLSELANRISSNSALAVYLVDSTQAAYGIQGAVDEDHRQLAILEDEVNRTVVSIQRLLNEVNETLARQNSYLSGERRNLNAIALAISNGESYGPNLANFANNPSAQLGSAGAGGRPPLVVIRFDRNDVQYEQALYNAVSTALSRRPAAGFDLVAVTPNQGSPADVAAVTNASKRNAQNVMRSLIAMGLPADRLTLSSATSQGASTSEVHVYIR